MRHVKEEGREEGRQEGLQEGRRAGLLEGHQNGKQEGMQEGIRILIEFCREMNCSREDTEVQEAEKFGLEQVQAGEYMKKYWKD